jgi:alanyl-tRNA synthetase
VLAATPFYVEAGGQVSDTGVIEGENWRIEIEDMRRPVSGLVIHIGEVTDGTPHPGGTACAAVNTSRRSSITRNHTATHLLHAALRHELGTHVQQRGSLVAPDRLRFDFAHDARVSPDALRTIEREVNQTIMRSLPVSAKLRSLPEARAEGAMALFGEKYGDTVRTISVGAGAERYSYELCGGVHVANTADIGLFLIVSEGSVSAGIRRVEALTGAGALEYVAHTRHALETAAHQLGAQPADLGARIADLQSELAGTRKQLTVLQRELARQRFDQLIRLQETIGGRQVLIAQIGDASSDSLREMSDWFRNAVASGIMVLGSVSDGKPQLVVAVTDDLTKQGLHAGNLIRQIAPLIGGGGGGRPTMAQAGGKDASRLPEALSEARRMLSQL